MKNSDIRDIIQICKEHFDTQARVEIVEWLQIDETDFCVENFRFIKKSEIDEIMTQEFEADEYALGHFDSFSLSKATGIDASVFDSIQDIESYEAAGKIVVKLKAVRRLVKIYTETENYGPHFSCYDGQEYDAINYYYFRIN